MQSRIQPPDRRKTFASDQLRRPFCTMICRGLIQSALKQRPGEVPSQLAVVLLASCRRLILVALRIGAVVNRRGRQELVGELVHRGTADSATNGLDHRRPVGVDGRIRDGTAGKEVKADGALTAKAGHGPGFTRDLEVPPKALIAKPLYHPDAVGGVAPIRQRDW